MIVVGLGGNWRHKNIFATNQNISSKGSKEGCVE